MEAARYIGAIILGYLLGAIPTGLVIGKLVKGIDLRDYGSGKTGATNALRTLGVVPTILVVAGDVLKGLAAVLLARLLDDSVAVQCLAGLSAAVGHNWPIYAGFRGGRGVLVSYGIFWFLCWPAALVTTFIGMVIIAASRMVSLGVLCGAAIAMAITVLLVVRGPYSPWVLLYTVLGAVLIVARHKDNIERLLAGTERKLGQPAQPAQPVA